MRVKLLPVVVAATVALLAGLGGAAGAEAATPGPILKACQKLTARSGNNRLVNGNFTLEVDSASMGLWHQVVLNGPSGPKSTGFLSWARYGSAVGFNSQSDATYLALYCNGDLALRSSGGRLLWHSNTANRGVSKLALTSHGDLALYSTAGRLVWHSHTGPTVLAANTILPSNSVLIDNSSEAVGTQTLAMQKNGNLVYRDRGYLVWQSGTKIPGSRAALTTKAQLIVIAPDGRVLFHTVPKASSYSYLELKLFNIFDVSAPMQRVVWYPGWKG